MRCDLHVHTMHSGMCNVPVFRKICRESYNDPLAVYDLLKRRGMNLVTITDHDSIGAAETLRKYPDFFVSEEVSCLTPDGGRAACVVAPGETPVITLHPHWKVLVGPVALAVLILAVVLVAITAIPFGKAAPIAALVLGGIAIVGVMWSLMIPLLRWRTTKYELTSRRLRVREGILSVTGRDIPLSRVTDVSFETTLLDRLLGAGAVAIRRPLLP